MWHKNRKYGAPSKDRTHYSVAVDSNVCPFMQFIAVVAHLLNLKVHIFYSIGSSLLFDYELVTTLKEEYALSLHN